MTLKTTEIGSVGKSPGETPLERCLHHFGGPNDADHQGAPIKSVNTPQNAGNLDLKLRRQAKSLGLIPGSGRWRAYVLGTKMEMKRRKQEKAGKNFRAV